MPILILPFTTTWDILNLTNSSSGFSCRIHAYINYTGLATIQGLEDHFRRPSIGLQIQFATYSRPFAQWPLMHLGVVGEKMFHCLRFEKVELLYHLLDWVCGHCLFETAKPATKLLVESRIVGANSWRIYSWLASISWLSKARKLKSLFEHDFPCQLFSIFIWRD